MEYIAQLWVKSLILCHIKTMETYCVNCKINTANKNCSVWKTNQDRLMLVSNCIVCGKKNSGFIKNQ